jgi:putative lipoic acid-binding regulatory protein
MKDYVKLQQMLEDHETFPHSFTYKFIGRNTPEFASSVAALERDTPALKPVASRESSGGAHLAKTYVFDAPSAEAIIDVYRAIEKLKDLMVVL